MNNNPTQRYRSPLRGFVVIGTFTVLVLLLTLLLINTLDPQARAARELANYRQMQIDQALTPVDLFVAALWRLFPPVLLIALSATGIAIAWRRWATHEYIKAQHITEITRAQTQQFPARLQTLTLHAGRQPLTVPPAALSPGTTALPSIERPITAPSFAALLEQGHIGTDREGRNQPLILGYGLDGPLVGDWRSLYSTGLGGLQGGGKTWTAVYLLAQSALNGARLVIGDPHAGISDESLAARIAPLTPALLCEIAEDDKRILAALKLADDELQRRKRGISKESWPLIVAIDEWTSLRRGELATMLPGLIEDFTTEGRKLNCHLMLLAQRWDKESVGDFRNTLASAYVHRMRPIEARMMTGLPAAVMPNDTLQLAPGECYLLDTRGQLVRVRIPTMTPDDIQQVARTIEERSNPKETTRPFGFRPSQPHEGTAEGATEGANHRTTSTASESAGNQSPEAVRVLTLIKSGKSISEVVKEMWGVTGGRAYQEKCSYVLDIIRRALANTA